jgi:hypothetical protein
LPFHKANYRQYDEFAHNDVEKITSSTQGRTIEQCHGTPLELQETGYSLWKMMECPQKRYQVEHGEHLKRLPVLGSGHDDARVMLESLASKLDAPSKTQLRWREKKGIYTGCLENEALRAHQVLTGLFVHPSNKLWVLSP